MNFLLLFSVIFFNNTLFAFNQKNLEYTCIIHEQKINQEAVQHIFSKEATILSIDVDADIFIEKEEILYLLGIQENSLCTPQLFLEGIETLSKKERFKEVSIALHQENNGIHIFFSITGNYLIECIRIEGIWYGADFYKQITGLHLYEIFDKKKVAKSVEKIKQYTQQQGYFDAQIQLKYQWNEREKLVTIIFNIQLEKRYTINKITLHHNFLSSIEQNIQKFFLFHTKKLTSHHYTHQIIEETLLRFINTLKKEGFFVNNIDIKEEINYKIKTVELFWNLGLIYNKQIIIKGNNFFPCAALLEHLYALFKKEHTISTSIIVEALLHFYKQHGFFDVSIKINNEESKTFFIIHEGLQKKIRQLKINVPEQEQKYFSLLKKILDPVLLYTAFNEENIDKILLTCIEQLKKEGFLDAHISSYSIEHLNDQEVILHIIANLGEKYFIHSISLQAAEHIKNVLIPHVKNNNFLLTANVLTEEYEKINNLLYHAGYIKAQVTHTIEKKEDVYILKWHIEEGAQTHLDKIIISGNPYINFNHVLKYLPEEEKNQTHKEHYIQYALENLKKLAIYERVELYPDIYNISLKRPLFLRFIPDNQFEIRTRLGAELQHIQDYQTFGGFTYKCGFSFILRNRFKKADVCQFDADFAKSHREIIISQSIPLVFSVFNHFPFSSVWILKMQGYDMRYEQPGVIGYPRNLYTVYRDGVLVNFYNSKQTSYFNFSAGFEIQKTTINNKKNALSIAHAIDFDVTLLGARIPYFFIDTSLLADFLDNKVEPRRGVSSLISCKSMVCLTKTRSSFTKLLYEQTFFMTFFSLVFGLRARFGYLFNQTFSKISPMERFYLGGSHSVRGYEADLFPPIHDFIDNEGKKIYVPRGGKLMCNINIEIKKKIFGYVSFVLLHDIGFLADHLQDFQKPVLHTTGFGIRLETPFGPLRFDIGRKWRLVYTHEKRYGWYVTFGRAF